MIEGAQYIVDTDGRRTAVLIPIEAYEDLLEDLHLGQVSRDNKDEPSRAFEEVVQAPRQANEIDG